MTSTEVRLAPYPPRLTAIGAADAPFRAALAIRDLPEGSMQRVTFGDLDVVLAHTPDGVLAIDDRCPHMSAPLSIGTLDGCEIDCPLHDGRFDLRTGRAVRYPTTGGLDPEGNYHPVWAPEGRDPKPDPPGKKAEARRFTRIRWLRYYPLRVTDGVIEVRVPA